MIKHLMLSNCLGKQGQYRCCVIVEFEHYKVETNQKSDPLKTDSRAHVSRFANFYIVLRLWLQKHVLIACLKATDVSIPPVLVLVVLLWVLEVPFPNKFPIPYCPPGSSSNRESLIHTAQMG